MLKSKIAVLLFNIFKKLFLFHYFFLKQRCDHERFEIVLKLSIRVSAVDLAVTRCVYRSNVGYSNPSRETYSNLSTNKINQ